MLTIEQYRKNFEIQDVLMREAHRARAMAMYVMFLQTLEALKRVFGGGRPRRPLPRASRRFATHG